VTFPIRPVRSATPAATHPGMREDADTIGCHRTRRTPRVLLRFSLNVPSGLDIRDLRRGSLSLQDRHFRYFTRRDTLNYTQDSGKDEKV
jgi:hypothetical protein